MNESRANGHPEPMFGASNKKTAQGWLMILPLSLVLASPAASAAESSLEVEGQGATRANERPKGLGPVAVSVELWGYEIEPAEVRIAVAKELGVTVTGSPDTAGALASVRAAKGGDLVVEYRIRGEEPMIRAVAAPERDDEVVEIAALLIGNLARNEASAWLSTQTKSEPQPEQAPAPESVPAENERPYYPVNLTLFHPLTTVPNVEKARVKVELGLFYSKVGQVEALSLNPVVLQLEGPAEGAQIAGVASFNREAGYGARVAGIFAYQQGDFRGAALAGSVLASRGRGNGAYAAGLVTYHDGPFSGAVISGGANVIEQETHGAVIAGAANVVDANVRGVQLAGAANVAEHISGGQVAAVNVSSGDLSGLQIGLVNVAGRVSGLQLGVVNVADDVNGASIGVVTVSKSGAIQPVLWTSTTTPANLGLRFYTGPLYAMPTLGFDYGPASDADNADDVAIFAPGFSLGWRVPIRRAFVDVDVNYSNPSPEFRFDEHTIDLRYRALVGFDVTDWFAPFIGGGVRHHFRTQGPAEESFDPEFSLGIQFL